MLSDLFQSKNAVAALILVSVGLLLGTVLPAVTSFPGWAAGFVGLCLGGIAGVLAMQGKGANRDELLAIRTGVKGAQRGERASRPAGLSEDLLHVFDSVDDLSGELASQKHKQREVEAAMEKLQGSVAQRGDQVSEVQHELARVLDALTNGLGDQTGFIDQTISVIQKRDQGLAALSEHVDQLKVAIDASVTMLEMKSGHDEVSATLTALAARVHDTVLSIEEMAHSSKLVARGADGLSKMTHETASSMSEIERSIDHVQSSAAETARLSEQAATHAERGTDAIGRLMHDIQRTRESSTEASAAIVSLGTRIEAMSEILTTIDAAAEQANLLALNAAIIAAQAGEHGRGFSVVATEIKELGERSAASNRELSSLIKTIEEQTNSAAHSLERGATNAERGALVSAEAELALKRIIDAAQKSATAASAIVHAALQQTQASRHVVDAIGRITQAVQHVVLATDEQARSSELVVTTAEKMRTLMQHVERSQQEQSHGGRQASTTMETLMRAITSVEHALRTQTRAAEEMTHSVERVREGVHEQERRLAGLTAVSERLHRVGHHNNGD